MRKPDRPLKIIQISAHDQEGGAAKMAWALHREFRNLGHQSTLLVGTQVGDDRDVRAFPKWPDPKSCGTQTRWQERRRQFDLWAGLEDFNFPATWKILDGLKEMPDVIHCHNLHGYYFDLRALPWLSRRFPTIVTLHDGWLLSGHCSHSPGCERWRSGCGRCPDLRIYPGISRDATRLNLLRKAWIYRRSRLHVTAPSQWLTDRASQSVLRFGAREFRAVPNGIDLSVYHPGDRAAARRALGIGDDELVLISVAVKIHINTAKDYVGMRRAAEELARAMPETRIRYLLVGDEAPNEIVGNLWIQSVPFEKDPRRIAPCYQASDIALHAAHMETWGLAVTEAMACGVPIVATHVGGIPEQVRALRWEGLGASSESRFDRDQATGILVPLRDPVALSKAVRVLARDADLRRQLGQNGAAHSAARFGLETQVQAYLDLYLDAIRSRANVGD